jgi:integrase
MRNNKKTASLYWYAKTPQGWKYFPATQAIRLEYPNGHFYVRNYVNGKRVYTVVEKEHKDYAHSAHVALQVARVRQNKEHKEVTDLFFLMSAARAYVKDWEARNAVEAAYQAQSVLNEFLPLCKVHMVKQVTRQHILDYHKALKDRGLSDRTLHNKHERLKAFLRFAGVDVKDKKLMPPAPKYEEGLPDIYEPSHTKAILKAADVYMNMVISLCLKLGLRDQEVMHAEWSDIDWSHAVFRVQGKPHFDFKVKDSEQRDVPISADLLRSLKGWQKQRPDTRLIVGTENDKPNTHLLRTLKRLAKRAGLNCGRCDGCKGKDGECYEWYLHKFRATYLTTLLRNGIDARTVQSYAGHSSLETTLTYLRPASAKEAQSKINAIKW